MIWAWAWAHSPVFCGWGSSTRHRVHGMASPTSAGRPWNWKGPSLGTSEHYKELSFLCSFMGLRLCLVEHTEPELQPGPQKILLPSLWVQPLPARPRLSRLHLDRERQHLIEPPRRLYLLQHSLPCYLYFGGERLFRGHQACGSGLQTASQAQLLLRRRRGGTEICWLCVLAAQESSSRPPQGGSAFCTEPRLTSR